MAIDLKPKGFVSIPDVRFSFNVGCLLDVPTGRIEYGAHGQAILNGGASGMVGLSSSANNFKSGTQDYIINVIMSRYDDTLALTYDTETTTDKARKAQISEQWSGTSPDTNFVRNGSWTITDACSMYGDEWFDHYREYMNVKNDNRKELMLTTPFVDWRKKPMVTQKLTIGAIDSLSKMTISSIAQSVATKTLGDAKTNATNMTSGLYKKMMLDQIPKLMDKGTCIFLMTAQIGNIIVTSQYDQPKKKLSGMKNTETHKGVSDEFTYNTTFIVRCVSSTPMKPDEIYPEDHKNPQLDEDDLQWLDMKFLRSKKGKTHLEMRFIASQRLGVPIPELCEWNYIKENGYEGVDAKNKGSMRLHIYPSVAFSRTTLRAKCKEDPRFLRAINVTSELMQMKYIWGDRDNIHCDMETLRKDLTALGYDVDDLLNTRGWWCYKESPHNEIRELCSYDLLRMRKGLYIPYWMKNPPEAAVKLNKEMKERIKAMKEGLK